MLKIKVPTDMSEVTVGQYQEIMAYADSNPTDRELTLKMVQVFCKIKDASIIEYADLIRISQHLANMLNDKPSLTVFWDDKGFIPNLSKITFGELIDLDNYLPQNKFLHKSMAILYRKVEARSRDLYTITPYEGAGDASEYKEMPLSIAMGAMLFFWTIAKDLVSDTLRYFPLPQTMTGAQILAGRLNLHHAGDGTAQYSTSQGATSQSLIKSPKNQRANV